MEIGKMLVEGKVISNNLNLLFLMIADLVYVCTHVIMFIKKTKNEKRVFCWLNCRPVQFLFLYQIRLDMLINLLCIRLPIIYYFCCCLFSSFKFWYWKQPKLGFHTSILIPKHTIMSMKGAHKLTRVNLFMVCFV